VGGARDWRGLDGGLEAPGDERGLRCGLDQRRRYRAAVALGRLPYVLRRAAVLKDLKTCFGDQAGTPDEVIEANWPANAWIGGAFTAYLRPGAWTRYGKALRPRVGRIHWAGTETATVWNGYFDGAVRSGEDAAAAVLGLLAEPQPTEEPTCPTGGLYRLDGLPADPAEAQRLSEYLKTGFEAETGEALVVREFHAEFQLDPTALPVDQGGPGAIRGGALSWEVVNQTALEAPAPATDTGIPLAIDIGVTRATVETTELLPPAPELPFQDGVGMVQFTTTFTEYAERDNPPPEPEVSPGQLWLILALDDAGALALCTLDDVTIDRFERETMRQQCVANALVTLPPVDGQPPV
jgi:hypothetical protein